MSGLFCDYCHGMGRHDMGCNRPRTTEDAATITDILKDERELRGLRALHAALLPEFQRHNASSFCECLLCCAFAKMANANPPQYSYVNLDTHSKEPK